MTQRAAMDAKQAAGYLGMCLSKLQRLSHAGLVPCRDINPGGKHSVFRYSPAALDQWLAGDGESTAPKVLPSCSRRSRRVRESTGL